MLNRSLKANISRMLDLNPAVVLVGARQVGKTTLAHEIMRERGGIYLDLERPSDRAKISDIEQFCALNEGSLLILDEVQRVPELFAPLRGIIDERRRLGDKTGQFLMLGSASMELLRQSSETLAGRIAYSELNPLNVMEAPSDALHELWHRGGFPDSFLRSSDQDSFAWRVDFVRIYLERDIPQLGPRIPAETLRRFWIMLAHNQGQMFNASSLARGLDVKSVTTKRYLDLMVDLLLLRRVQPWKSNIGRRLLKSPKTYIRDSGICHALLGIETLNDLLGHPVVGGSWEGFIIENILGVIPDHRAHGYYRNTGGAEIDLIIEMKNGDVWAIEIKRTSSPKVSRGFYSACEDLMPARKFIVHAGEASFPLSSDIDAVTIHDMMSLLGQS